MFTEHLQYNSVHSVGEDLPGLVLDHELHVLDTLAPGANLLSHGDQLLSVQNTGLDPGQHDALLNLVYSALDKTLTESFHNQQFYLFNRQCCLLGNFCESNLSGGCFPSESHLHQAEKTNFLKQLGLHRPELGHVPAVEDEQEVRQPGVLRPPQGIQNFVSQQFAKIINFIAQNGCQGQEESMFGLFFLAQILQIGTSKIFETCSIKFPMFPLNPVQITAEKIKLGMDRTDSINLIKNLLGLLDDILGLLQLIVLVQLDLAHQHSAQDEGFIVHLGLLLNLLDEGNSLLWISEPLHHSLGDLNQGQGVQSGLEIHEELLIDSDQFILKTWFLDQILKKFCKLMPQLFIVKFLNFCPFCGDIRTGTGLDVCQKLVDIRHYYDIFSLVEVNQAIL